MRVFKDGKWIPVEEFEGPTEAQEEAAAFERRKAARQKRVADGGAMTSGTHFLQGDPRKARKSFRFL